MAQVFHHGCEKQLKSVPGFKVLLTTSFEARWWRVKGLDISWFFSQNLGREQFAGRLLVLNLFLDQFFFESTSPHHILMTQIDPSKQCWDLMDRPETDETYETFGPCDVSGALHWHQRLWQHCTATWFRWRWGRWCHHQIAAGLCYPPRLPYTIPKGVVVQLETPIWGRTSSPHSSIPHPPCWTWNGPR